MLDSPKVIIQEFDGSLKSAPLGNVVTFFAGFFEKGAINTPISVTTPLEFKQTFGRANANNYNDWYQVYNYLLYPTNPNIIVIRTINQEQSFNATASVPFKSRPMFIKDLQDFELKYDNFLEQENFIKVCARNPGEWGNLLEVCIFTAKEYIENKEIKKGFYAKNIVNYIKQGYYCIAIFRKDVLVERYLIKFDDYEIVNKESNYIYIKMRLNDYRIYDGNIWWVDGNEELADGNLPNNKKPVFYGTNSLKLKDGVSVEPSLADLDEAYSIVDNTEEYEIDFVIGNERNYQSAVKLVEKRRDCVAFIDTDLTDIKQIINKSQEYLNEFVYFTANKKKQYDYFRNKTIYTSINGDIAGLRTQLINTIGTAESHSKIKYNLLEVIDIKNKFMNAEKDELYQNNINLLTRDNNTIYFQGERTLRKGFTRDFTTRLILNKIERKCTKISKYFVFEFNDTFTREAYSSQIRQVLLSSKYDNELEDFKVICDITNNPDEVIDHNKMICDVYIKPKYLVEVINLRFTAL